MRATDMATTPMTEQEQTRRAFARALAHGGARTVTPGYYVGTYRVRSASRGDSEGLAHDVATDTTPWMCSCEAALSGRASCWHRAAVAIHQIEASGARVTSAAAPTRRPRKEVALV